MARMRTWMPAAGAGCLRDVVSVQNSQSTAHNTLPNTLPTHSVIPAKAGIHAVKMPPMPTWADGSHHQPDVRSQTSPAGEGDAAGPPHPERTPPAGQTPARRNPPPIRSPTASFPRKRESRLAATTTQPNPFTAEISPRNTHSHPHRTGLSTPTRERFRLCRTFSHARDPANPGLSSDHGAAGSKMSSICQNGC